MASSVIGILSWRLYTTLIPAQPPDLVYDLYITALQSHLELYLGIIAANLPMLGPLLTRMPKTRIFWFGRSSPSSGPDDSAKKAHPLITFGSWGRERQKLSADELYLLTIDDERINNNRPQTVRSLEIEASVEPSNNGTITPPAYSAQITPSQVNDV